MEIQLAGNCHSLEILQEEEDDLEIPISNKFNPPVKALILDL